MTAINPRRVLNYLRRVAGLYAVPWLSKFAGGPPLRLKAMMLWPGTYIAYAPDRYFVNADNYRRRGGEFGFRYLGEFVCGNELSNSGDMPRYFGLALICDQVIKEGLQGDVAELGVYKGNTAVLLAALARKLESTAYLLDTYEGFASDDLTGIDADKSLNFSDTNLSDVQALVGSSNVRYVKGRFPNTTKQIASDSRFCVVHIDCDLYSPFKAALHYFYPRLVQGAFLIMHDYGGLYWNGAENAVDEFFADKPERIVPLPDKSGTVVVRKL